VCLVTGKFCFLRTEHDVFTETVTCNQRHESVAEAGETEADYRFMRQEGYGLDWLHPVLWEFTFVCRTEK
jgi:hypothetical protein